MVKCIKAEVWALALVFPAICIVRWDTSALWAPLNAVLANWKQLHRVSWQNEADEHIAYDSVWYIVELLPIHHSLLAALIATSLLKAKILCDSFGRNPNPNICEVTYGLHPSLCEYSCNFCRNNNMFDYSLLPEAQDFSKIWERPNSKTDLSFEKGFWLLLALHMILMVEEQEGNRSKKWSQGLGTNRDVWETDF